MIVLAGGDIVLPNRVIPNASLIIDGNRIAAIDPRASIDPEGARVIKIDQSYVVPGFIDVHVHGVAGIDTLDDGDAVASIAARLPQYGVTAFCPTTVACEPSQLGTFLREVAQVTLTRPARSARVLPAHLESNFINPEYKGAQPATCLRQPLEAARSTEGDFCGADILEEIATARAQVGIVTLAPELPGGIDLIRDLVAAGHRVSLGHSAADFDTAIAAIEAGARHATHLFNRMAPMSHRAPGLAGAVLARTEVAAELICDGHHVHPAFGHVAIAAKGPTRVMAITDGTAGAGLRVGATARLGGRTIHVAEAAAFLDDGTLAGSTLTMDRAFRNLMTMFGRTIVDAATLCATTAAQELRLDGLGVLAEGSIADLVVLDRDYNVLHTVIDGEIVYTRRDETRGDSGHL
jgi:N-acetylglucosamine-6-phosphate deacetylase